MEQKFYMLNVKRPKTREELRQDAMKRTIAALSVAVVVLAMVAAGVILLFAARAADVEADLSGAAVVPTEEVRMMPLAAEPETAEVREDETVEETVPSPAPVETVAPTYSQEDLELLALVIYQEAGGDGCTDETRRMVGEVALNRVASSRYPDTLEEVLTQKQQYGRLYWTGLVWPERASTAQEAHAVERAYECAALVLEAERLLPADTIYQAEFIQGEIVAQVPGYYFCRG